MKKLTDQEYSHLVVQISRAIDNHFEDNPRFVVTLSEAGYCLDELVGVHVITCRVIVQKIEEK